MRKLLIFLVAVFTVSGVSFAQDAGTPNRSLGIYLDTCSGHLTEDIAGNKRTFEGAEFDFGMTYAQNFATVPWLTMSLKFNVVMLPYGTVDPVDGWQGSQGISIGDGNSYGMPKAQVGLNFGGYSFIGLDTRGILVNENYYSVNLGNAGSLTFMTALEIFAAPVYRGAGWEAAGYDSKHKVLDLFALRMDYGISFAKSWKYATKISFRWNNDATAKAFGESFNIRWENNVSVNVTDKFYMWTQLRYEIKNIASDSLAIDNRLFLQAGLGYTFDVSGI